jgi:prepilin-type N-terminal cleavage/methylation domain-containing protein
MRRKGFTLVELLVVIAIIAVIMAILIPSLNGARDISKRLLCSERLSGQGRAFHMYVTDFDDKLPLLENYSDAVPSIQSTYLLAKRITAGIYWVHFGCLWGAGYVDDGRTFYCPAIEGWNGEADRRGQNDGSYNGSISPSTGLFADLRYGWTQGPKATLGYCYWPLAKEPASVTDVARITSSSRNRYVAGYPLNATRVCDLAQGRPIASDNRYHSVKGVGWNINTLYPDGHTIFQRQPRRNGLGMYSRDENNQFPESVYNTRFLNDVDRNENMTTGVTPTEFAHALE